MRYRNSAAIAIRGYFVRYSLFLVSAAMLNCVSSLPLGAEEPAPRSVTTIATLPFDVASDDQRFAPLAHAIGDMLMVRLSDADGLVFVERTAIDKVLGEMELAAATSSADRAKLGRLLGAKFVLTGSLTVSAEQFQLVAHLLDVSTARVAVSAKVLARAEDLTGPVDELAKRLASRFSGTLPALTQDQIDRSPEANLHFMRALGFYYAGMPEQATTQFMQTLAINPAHAEARFFIGLNYLEGTKEYGHARIEFSRFLAEFASHRLVDHAKRHLKTCEARIGDAATGAHP